VLTKYFQELEHDFAAHLPGLDWRKMWRRRQWKRLLWHIDHLPRNSLYHEAMATDPELARQMAEAGDDLESSDPRPSVSEFDLHADLLTTLVNETRMVRAAIIGAAGGGNSKVDMLKGPKYAIEDVALEVRQKQHASLAARLLPHKYPQGPSDQE